MIFETKHFYCDKCCKKISETEVVQIDITQEYFTLADYYEPHLVLCRECAKPILQSIKDINIEQSYQKINKAIKEQDNGSTN